MSNPLRTVLVLATIGLMLAVPATSAQEASEEVYNLSLDDALRTALKNNLDLVSARFAPRQAEQDIHLQEAGFDAGLEASLDYQKDAQPVTQTSSISGQEQAQIGASMVQNLKYGADYSFGYGIRNTDIVGPNVLTPRLMSSGFQVTYNQPLLKGFGTEPVTEQLILAENNLEISKDELEGQAETLLQTVEGAYWDVVAAREALRIARLALVRADDLLALNRKKVEVGTLAPIEITQAEAGVASQEEGVILAEVQLEDAQDELRRLLAVPDGDPIWAMSIVNSDRPVFEKKDVDLDTAIQTALASRSEMHVAEQVVRNSQLNERVARREKRHQLDFTAFYGPSGVSQSFAGAVISDPGGGPDIVIPPSSADINEAVANVFDGDLFTWSAGLVYRVPLGNRAARASYAKATLGREKSEVDLRNQEQTIRVEVRRAVRGVDSGIKRVEAARKNVELQQEKLDAEQKKFDNGMSTSFEVLTFQNDLADAELSAVRAALDYLKALAALERAQGTLMEKHHLSLKLASN